MKILSRRLPKKLRKTLLTPGKHGTSQCLTVTLYFPSHLTLNYEKPHFLTQYNQFQKLTKLRINNEKWIELACLLLNFLFPAVHFSRLKTHRQTLICHQVCPRGSLDPNSPAYITQLYEALGLNGNNYAHLDPEILAQLKDLIAKYPHVFWLPGAPLSPIKGFDHRIPTGDAPPVYRLSRTVRAQLSWKQLKPIKRILWWSRDQIFDLSQLVFIRNDYIPSGTSTSFPS